MAKRRVYYGWITQQERVSRLFDTEDGIVEMPLPMYKKKPSKTTILDDTGDERNWPPKRIRITVEEV